MTKAIQRPATLDSHGDSLDEKERESKDLRGLQRRALADGIPYQTLVASVLHKFVEGRFSERA